MLTTCLTEEQRRRGEMKEVAMESQIHHIHFFFFFFFSATDRQTEKQGKLLVFQYYKDSLFSLSQKGICNGSGSA